MECIKELKDFLDNNSWMQLGIWGCGISGNRILEILRIMGLKNDFWIDTYKEGCGIYKPDSLFNNCDLDSKHTIILVAAIAGHMDIISQLEENQIIYFDCYDILIFLREKDSGVNQNTQRPMFPGFYSNKTVVNKINGKPEDKRLICMEPFNLLHLYPDYSTTCCPHYINFVKVNPEDILNVNDLQEVWNSPLSQQIRASVIDGSYCFCDFEVCPAAYKMKEYDELDIQDKQIIDNKELELSRGPKFLNVGIDLSCNLACRMCHGKAIVDFDNAFTKKWVDMILNYKWVGLESMLISGGGEVFFSPNNMKILKAINRERFPDLKRIDVFSNGIFFNEKNWNEYIAPICDEYDIDVTISIDAASKDTYEAIRVNGKFEVLKKNLEFLSSKKENIRKFQWNFCVQNRNFEEMIAFAKWGKSLKADYIWFQVLREGMEEDNVHKKYHKNFKRLCEILKDPIFEEEGVDTLQLKIAIEEEIGKGYYVNSKE